MGDRWSPKAGATFERANPADLDDVMGPYFSCDAKACDAALSGAVSAQRDWARKPAPLRGEILRRAADIVRSRADAIAAVLTREEGKTLAESKGEVLGGAQIIELAASAGWWDRGQVVDSMKPGTLLYTRRQPLGLVAAITPWNFPFSNPAIKLASALVAGNAVVWKPASWTPATAIALTECFIEAGLPEGLLTTLLGPGSLVGELLAGDPRVRAISFTGSTEVGRALATTLAARGARAQLEMGGKNAIVVLEDADMAAAARATALGAFLSAGQKCTAASRAIVVRSVRDRFLEALIAETRALRVGPPTDATTRVGPVVHPRQLEGHLAAVAAAVHEGARVVEGGHRLDGDLARGTYMAPTILDGVAAESAAAQEEIFGPVLVVIDADDHAAALRAANGTRYGLAAAIFTRDLERAFEFAERCEAGVVKINEQPPGMEPHVAAGGWKASGAGDRELGPRALDFFTEEKTVYVHHGMSS